jgi:plasmid maintenance system antidote protein VapI
MVEDPFPQVTKAFERLAHEETGITADATLLLTKALSISAHLWLNLQNTYDVQTAEKEIGKDLAKIEPVIGPRSAAAEPENRMPV